MKKLLGIVIVLLVVSVPLYCQDTPKAEVFGGYQYTHIGYGIPGTLEAGDHGAESYNGWNGAFTVWAKPWLGVTGDVSGAYKSDVLFSGSGLNVKVHTFMFGPTIASHSNEKFVPFAHVLFGGAHCSASGGGPDTIANQCIGAGTNSFAMAFGGGLDVGSKKIAFRVGQFDYIYTRFGHDGSADLSPLNHQNTFRYSAGIVFRF